MTATNPFSPADSVAHAREAALTAWAAIRHYYQGTYETFHKPDGPATDADRLADRLIGEHLERLYPAPATRFLTEESEDDPGRLDADHVWIIDPIDGTSSFICGDGNFAMHIALVSRGGDGAFHPSAATVYHPVPGLMYSAARGRGALCEGGVTPECPEGTGLLPMVPTTSTVVSEMTAVIGSTSKFPALLSVVQTLPLKGHYRRGSLGVKMMDVACGRADFYINAERGRCKEWDTCAPHLILAEAGGKVTGFDGSPLLYNQRDVSLHSGVLASNGHAHERLLHELRGVPGLM